MAAWVAAVAGVQEGHSPLVARQRAGRGVLTIDGSVTGGSKGVLIIDSGMGGVRGGGRSLLLVVRELWAQPVHQHPMGRSPAVGDRVLSGGGDHH